MKRDLFRINAKRGMKTVYSGLPTCCTVNLEAQALFYRSLFNDNGFSSPEEAS